MKENDNQDKSPKEKFSIGYFRPEDAEGLVRLFQAVYGSHYPISLFYDADAIIRANAEQSYLSFVARSESGDVVGAAHLYRSAPCKSLYECGVGLVSKEFRAAGIQETLMEFIHQDYVPRHPHIEELFGEAVCNHVYMQRAALHLKYVETVLEVALMPADAYDKEKSATGRVATVASFNCFQPKPHRIYLPKAYEQELRTIYGRLDDSRDLDLSQADVPGNLETRIDLAIYDSAQMARIAVHAIGTDFRERLLAKEKEAMDGKTEVFQVWLDLTQPHVGEAVEMLRRAGYFLGGILPRWFDGDAILMQKLLCPPYFEEIKLYSEHAKELLEVVKKDWQRAQGS